MGRGGEEHPGGPASAQQEGCEPQRPQRPGRPHGGALHRRRDATPRRGHDRDGDRFRRGVDQHERPHPAQDSDDVGPDLQLVKTVNPGSIVAGEVVTYTFIINNLGPVTATGVQVIDPFPVGLVFVDADSLQTRAAFRCPTVG